MPGHIILPPPPPHKCEGRPPADHFKPATVWQCDECGKKYVVVEGAQYNESYTAWRPLTEYNKDGSDHG